MRALFFVALLAASAQGGTITVELGGFTTGAGLSLPRSAAFEIGPTTSNDVQLAWEIGEINPSNSSQTFVLTEETATAAGVDWATLENMIVNERLQHDYRARFANGTPWSAWPEYPTWNPGFVMHDLERVEFEVFHFVSSPAGSSASWTSRLIGEGIAIPEPAAILLMVIGLVHLANFRSRIS